jgi:thiol:disulfide interchange protein DsbD
VKRHIKRILLYIGLISILSISNGYSQSVFDDIDDESFPLVEIQSLFSYKSVLAGNSYYAAVIVDIAPKWHINSASPNQDWLIPANLSVNTIEGITPHSIIYPEGKDIKLLGEMMSVYDNSVIIYFSVDISNNLDNGTYSLPIELTVQPCNDKECRAPETIESSLSIEVGELGGATYQNVFDKVPTIKKTTQPDEIYAEQSEIKKLISEYGFWGYILALGLAFVTGLLLSFSPCTYPMIPITVSIFAGQERSIGRGFVLSLFYVGTMAVVYGIMGLIVSLVGGVFGAWLASPPVVIGIVVIFVIFALSMFGLYNLEVPASIRNKFGAAQTGKGITGAIVLGVVAALVVSPCVGPFVAGILLYIATIGSPIFGFLTLFIFAIGLGTLYIIIGTFSSSISKLPGAGEWMESVKKFFGFVLLLMAIYFLRTLLPFETILLLTGLLLLAFSIFGGGFDRLTKESRFFDRLKKFVGILAFLISIYLLLGSLILNGFILPEGSKLFPFGQSNTTDVNLIQWNTDLENGLADALAQGKPVLIDTWATWCINCKVLEEKTFNHPMIVEEAKRFYPLKIQLEKSDSPETKAFMERFGLKTYSLPTTLLLNSNGKVQKILIGVVEPEDMKAEMQKVN